MARDQIIENVKRATIEALKKTFDADHPDPYLDGDVWISMDYPMEQTHYPALWVRFSLRDYQKAGLSNLFYDDESRPYRKWMFKGTITLVINALDSATRDRMAGGILDTFAFSDMNAATQEFYDTIAADPRVSFSFNKDEIRASGQGENPGAPWNPDQIVYEDSYAIDIIGEFNSSINPDYDPVFLREIDHYQRTVLNGEVISSDANWPVPDDGNGKWI